MYCQSIGIERATNCLDDHERQLERITRAPRAG